MSAFTQQQREAITASGNVLVVAGAGTGKTHTLVSRCLRLIAEKRVSLESILMVTFTEAAAAEMRARLRQELLKLQTARLDDEHLAQQLALLDTAHISTLHGFCLQLTREHFHQLGLDPQFGVLDEQQTSPLQREALDEILERHYSGGSETSRTVRELIRVFGRGSDAQIRKLVLKLHAFTQSLAWPAVWLEEQNDCFENPEPIAWRERFAQAVISLCNEWLGELEKHRGGTPAVNICAETLKKLPANPSLDQVAKALRTVVETDKPKENWPRGSKGSVRDVLSDFFDDAEFLAGLLPGGDGDPLAQDWEWCRGQMTALLNLAREFTAEFDAKKRDLGGVDFADLEQCALKLLYEPASGAPTAIAREWCDRLNYVFVDEYQDINAAQDAILTALSREGVGANRFLVGDVKQSIYRFRLANPKIFSSYAARWQKNGADGKRIPLTENFRSREALLNFVNPLFATLMREETGGVAYEALEFGGRNERVELAAMPGEPASVEFHLVARSDKDDGADEDGAEDATAAPDLLTAEREARLAARRLREMKESGRSIWDKEQNKFRPVEWGDMAVLLRSPAGRAEVFAMEFNRAGVPLSAARDGFFASLEVSDLLNLLKLLDNPLQDVPLLAVLRSPLVGMSLDELAEIRAGSGKDLLFWTALLHVQSPKSKVQSQQSDLSGKVDLFLKQFSRWRELVRQTSLSQTLEAALMETHYEALLLAGERGLERVANVRRLLDLARQFDPYQRQGLYRFLRFVQSQEDEEMDLQPAVPTTSNAVRLMSIHKSKGLEFPVVVLAALGTRFNEQDLNESLLFNESFGLCPKITPPDAGGNYPGLTHWLARRDERRELRGEQLRLLYVAMTRARDHLFLVGTSTRKIADVIWGSEPDDAISTHEVLNARSHLDWLMRWLPLVSTAGNWSDGRAGENKLLRWQIYEDNDPVFADPGANDLQKARISGAFETPPSEEAVEKLKARLTWSYPYLAATERAAKTNVTALRRQADEVDEEAEQVFKSKIRPPSLRIGETRSPKSKIGRGLSAREIGLSHHRFLQFAALEQATDEGSLSAEAKRLRLAGILTTEQVGALDFARLAKFWQSDVGAKIRGWAQNVKRELEFTARFGAGELDELLRPTLETGAVIAVDDFVVVQGVADLVVLLPDQIWLLDFKTDELAASELASKVEQYSIQLRLYALALARIYHRPVTQCWLHFLSANETASVDLS